MGYRHLTPNLKQALGRHELEEHMKLVRRAFPKYQSTGYWMPDGVNWKSEVHHHSFDVSAVEGNFGVSVGLNPPNHEYHRRLFTLYPSLKIAVVDSDYTIHYRGRHKPAFAKAVARLETLGYQIASKRSDVDRKRDSYESDVFKYKPFAVATSETRLFQSEMVINTVVSNLNTVVSMRPAMPYVEIAVFSPPGDGGGNSPVGRTKQAIKYAWPRLNIGRKVMIPIVNGVPLEEKVRELMLSLDSRQAIGICSHATGEQLYTPPAPDPVQEDLFLPQQPLSQSESTISPVYLDIHTPMFDFQCSSPEDAIHTLEHLGVSVDKKDVVLIDSGNSFHAYLPRMQASDEEAKRFLESLKKHDTVCEKWIPLQHEQKYQLLRISPCVQKPRLPVVLGL